MIESFSLDTRFRSTLFSALSAVLLADGRVDRREVAALEAAARALDLPSGAAALGAAMLGSPEEMATPTVADLDRRQRALVYAAAEWMAMADGGEAPVEIAALDELRASLGLGDARAARLHELASRVRSASTGQPSQIEFEALLIAARRIAEEPTESVYAV